ncbi:MAG: DNA adenine methylase, partial [Waterburya sp.]
MAVNSPVLWCGKKKQLIKYISQYYPTTINNYYEPFVGGGSVFFDIYARQIVQGNYYISDLNERLIRIYEVIRNDLNGLLNDLQKHCSNPNALET